VLSLKKKKQDGARGAEGVAETPKPGDPRLSRSSALVVGNNKLAASEVHLCTSWLALLVQKYNY
jgi:hypothetical protein